MSWGKCWVRSIPAREARGQTLGAEGSGLRTEAAKGGPLHRGGPAQRCGALVRGRARECEEGSEGHKGARGGGDGPGLWGIPKGRERVGVGWGKGPWTGLEAPGVGCLRNPLQHRPRGPACWAVGLRGPTSWHVLGVGNVGVKRDLGNGHFRVLCN